MMTTTEHKKLACRKTITTAYRSAHKETETPAKRISPSSLERDLKVLPGLEPGLPESESGVITTTLQNREAVVT
jgi:hypothetical protein